MKLKPLLLMFGLAFVQTGFWRAESVANAQSAITDGHFTYVSQTDVYGALNQRVTGQSSVVASPEPSGLPVLYGLVMLVLLRPQRRGH